MVSDSDRPEITWVDGIRCFLGWTQGDRVIVNCSRGGYLGAGTLDAILGFKFDATAHVTLDSGYTWDGDFNSLGKP